jgi:hypothetical protein
LAFFLSFTLDVRVHASQVLTVPEVRDVIEQPPGCLNQKICSVMTKENQKYIWQVSDGRRVIVAPNSIVVKAADDRIRLVQGAVWIQSEGNITVETEYGVARTEQNQFWVLRQDQKMWVRAPATAVTISARGAQEEMTVPAGCENWLGPVSRQGVGRSGFPQPIDLNDHMNQWARLRTGSKKEFSGEFEQFIKTWADAVAAIAVSHQQIAEREIASADEQRQRQIAAHERALREAQEIRALFRKKNYIDP